MKKRIIIPIDVEFEIDERFLNGTIENVIVHERKLSKKEVERLFKASQQKDL